MAFKDPIQSPPPDAANISWHKWFYDLYTLLTGRQGRQNFINVLTNPSKAGDVFVVKSNGDAAFVTPPSATDISFRVYQVNTQSVPDSLFTSIAFDTAIFDTNGAVSLATGQFTAPEDGKYYITALVSYLGAPAMSNSGLALSKNGSIQAYNQTANQSANVADSFCLVSDLFDLVVGDYITADSIHNFGAPTNTNAGIASCYFAGFKVN